MPTNNGLSELPTPPPAIRPPESVTAAQPASAPMPQAEAPQQPEPAEHPPVPAQSEPVVAPEPVQIQPAPPAVAPEPELPAMAPVEEPVHDYFATPEPAAETLPEMAPIAEVPAPAEPVETVSVEPVQIVATAAPVEEPVAELPAMAPAEPVAEVAPVEFMGPQPVEAEAQIEREPEPEVQVEDALPALEPIAEPEPVSTTELEELFAHAPAQSGEFCVVVRLKDGEGMVEVGSFRNFGTAMEGAQEVIEQFSNASEGQWPFYAGRFIRPDLIVSVDVVDANETQR